MLVHWVLIVFIHSAADVVASTKMNILPLDYGAVFPSREACESWGEDRILDEEIVEAATGILAIEKFSVPQTFSETTSSVNIELGISDALIITNGTAASAPFSVGFTVQ